MIIKKFETFINEKIIFKHSKSMPVYIGGEKILDGESTIKIFNDDKEIGYINPKYKGNIPIDPKKHFTDEEIIEQGYDINKTFPNSVLLSGGYQIHKEYRGKGLAKESIKQYFLDNPDIENIFLYAIPWQGSIPFWYKIGGKSILKVETDKKGIHYIQLNRNEVLNK